MWAIPKILKWINRLHRWAAKKGVSFVIMARNTKTGKVHIADINANNVENVEVSLINIKRQISKASGQEKGQIYGMIQEFELGLRPLYTGDTSPKTAELFEGVKEKEGTNNLSLK